MFRPPQCLLEHNEPKPHNLKPHSRPKQRLPARFRGWAAGRPARRRPPRARLQAKNGRWQ